MGNRLETGRFTPVDFLIGINRIGEVESKWGPVLTTAHSVDVILTWLRKGVVIRNEIRSKEDIGPFQVYRKGEEGLFFSSPVNTLMRLDLERVLAEFLEPPQLEAALSKLARR